MGSLGFRVRRYFASHAWPCPKTIPSPTLCIMFAFFLHLGFAFFLHCHVGLHYPLHFFCIVMLACITLCIFLHCHVGLHHPLHFLVISCWLGLSNVFVLHCHVGLLALSLHFWSGHLARQLVCMIVLHFCTIHSSCSHALPFTQSTHSS